MKQLQAASTAPKTLVGGAHGLLQRQCACGNHSAAGECGDCRRKRLQRKALSISDADSPLEAEADRVAAAITAGDPTAATDRALPQLSRAATEAASGGEAPPLVETVLNSPGQALDGTTRSFMEPRFGRDFSHVRIHTDAQAQESARAVDAAAYTVGPHVVFGAGRFQPHSIVGQQLLAHELTHVLQQAPNTATAVSLQRQPAGGGSKAAPFIKEVVVDQNSRQQVTATLSDGSSFSGVCSTGKGHCCFDASAGAAEGGACSESRSNQVGNNCTPIGTFTVTKKIGSGPIPFWTQFHDAKSVALHQYFPVTGEPLSHGCVRLNADTAEKIFKGAVVGATRVTVKGLAKPKCDDTVLQNEWAGDFATAGSQPLDGERVQKLADHHLNKKEVQGKIDESRRQIRDERTALKSALNRDDAGLDAELAALGSGAPTVSRIPRCVAAKTVEEQKLPEAQKSGFLGAGAATIATDLSKALTQTHNAADAEKVVKKFGEKLWQDATAAARGGGAGSDDRQIYWTRLQCESALREWDPWWAVDADALRRMHAGMLQLFEQTSRGMTGAAFGKNPDQKRILISGFDPFGFQSGGNVRQSNASGAAALALNGEILSDGKVSAQVQSVVYPVRYADFDAGIVEDFLRPHLTGPNPPNLVMSISQGRTKFELEESAGRRRSTDTFQDNLGRVSGGSPGAPVEPPGLAAGPEFLKTNVPAATLKSMRGALGRSSSITEETEVQDLPAGATQPRHLPAGPDAQPGLAVEGSGGGFLSNEIFYRNSLLRSSSGSSVPVIHLHTPALPPGASDAQRNALIDTIRKVLTAALAGI